MLTYYIATRSFVHFLIEASRDTKKKKKHKSSCCVQNLIFTTYLLIDYSQ